MVDDDNSVTWPVVYRGMNEHHVSEFSARGPSLDGRLKPDVMAPGESIISSKSDQRLTGHSQCRTDGSSLKSLDGTSMATPVTAGAAAMVRQYFMDGYYLASKDVTFQVGSNRGNVPSAALVKAVLINSGVGVKGSVPKSSEDRRTTIPVGTMPSHFFGWGRVQLDQTLAFLSNGQANEIGYQTPRFNLTVMDGTNAKLGRDANVAHCFNVVDDTRPLKVTLVWTDPEAVPLASVLLVNNLDLAGNPMSHAVSLSRVKGRGEGEAAVKGIVLICVRYM
jgi:hypothetical protein